jgi:hypothetical protein
MPASTRRKRAAPRCRNCDLPTAKLGYVVLKNHEGVRRLLPVCRWCYAQLRRHPIPTFR